MCYKLLTFFAPRNSAKAALFMHMHNEFFPLNLPAPDSQHTTMNYVPLN